jgi:hypothetical protein
MDLVLEPRLRQRAQSSSSRIWEVLGAGALIHEAGEVPDPGEMLEHPSAAMEVELSPILQVNQEPSLAFPNQ